MYLLSCISAVVSLSVIYSVQNWRNTMIARNMTPATEKVGQPMHPSQTGTQVFDQNPRWMHPFAYLITRMLFWSKIRCANITSRGL